MRNEKNWDYDACYEYMVKRRPVVASNDGFVVQLKEYYNKTIMNN